MKYHCTNYELESMHRELSTLSQSDKAIPACAAYCIAKNRIAVRNALEPYAMIREQIVRRHSGGKDGISREENPEAFEACVKELDGIGKKSVEVDFSPIALKDLESASFTLAEMESLMPMISNEEG